MAEIATATAPESEKISWTTPKEMEQYEGMLDKRWLRLGTKTGEPISTEKGFFYKITGMHPSEPALRGPKDDRPSGAYQVVFEVQKYHRDKFYTANEDVGGSRREVQKNEPVIGVKIAKVMNQYSPIVTDENANMHILASEFVRRFRAE